VKYSFGFISAALFVGLLGAAPAMAQTATGVPMPPNPMGNYGEHHPYAERANSYFDSHPQEAAELQKHPGLIDDPKYLHEHPDLESYLHSHPGVRNRFKSHPEAFMHREEHFNANYNWNQHPHHHMNQQQWNQAKEHWQQNHPNNKY
jgi:hypothetical protein